MVVNSDAGFSIRVRLGKVESLEQIASDLEKVTAITEDGSVVALCYPSLTGRLSVGDDVAVNTTASYLSLGTGSYNVIMGKWPCEKTDISGAGHIIKLRYTPMQLRCLALEEEGNPLKADLDENAGLQGTPVVVAPLHSHIMSIAPTLKFNDSELKIVYVMTDSAALPIAVSENVRTLKEKGLIELTITCGQAFGGDHEAVNVYTALIAARSVFKADVIIVAPGPGKVGTDSKFGFSEIEQGEVLNAVGILGGTAIGVLRINHSDKDYRHYGISSHSMTILTRICLKEAIVPAPITEGSLALDVAPDLDELRAQPGLTVKLYDVSDTDVILAKYDIFPTTMGKSHQEEPIFFSCGVAAGKCAIEARDQL